MNRRKFFAFLGIGAAAAVVAPKALAAEPNRLLGITKMQNILTELQMRHEPVNWKEVMDKLDIEEVGPIARGIAERIEANNKAVSKILADRIPNWFKTQNDVR